MIKCSEHQCRNLAVWKIEGKYYCSYCAYTLEELKGLSKERVRVEPEEQK